MEIVLRNLTHTINDRVLLNNINLTFDSNNIYGIIGNSAGELTDLIHMCTSPTIGSIIIDNVEINKYEKNIDIKKIKANIGYVSTKEKFLKQIVKDEIKQKYISVSKSNQYTLERIAKSLKIVGLSVSFLNRKVSTLSSSEKFKVKLATALINNQKIILFDEPTKDLSLNDKKELIKLIRMLKNKYNKTIIIATTDIEFIHKIATIIHVIKDGKVIKSGSKYEVFGDAEIMNSCGIEIPHVMKFSNRVKELKNVKLGYRDEINDLIKDIYRNVT